MSDREIRDALASAYEPPGPKFRARIRSRLLEGRPAAVRHWGFAAGVVMSLLVVATLLATPRLTQRVTSAMSPGLSSSPTALPLLAGTPGPLPAGGVSVDSVQLLSPSLGWAVVSSPSSMFQTLYRTADDGATWTPSLQGQFGDLAQTMSFADDLHGVVLGDRLYRTADGGATWTVAGVVPWPLGARADSPPLGRLVGPHVSFINWWEGWVLVTGSPATQCTGNGGAIYHTIDGGQRWVKMLEAGPDMGPDHGVSFTACLTGIYFHDRLHGWMTTQRSYGPQHVFWTGDGGVNWHDAELAYCPGQTNEDFPAAALEPAMWDQRHGVLPTAYRDDLCAYRTTDGGHTWSSPTLIDPDRAVGSAPVLFIRDPTHWWLAFGRRLDRSLDGGRSWTTMPDGLPAGVFYASLDFVDSTDGWAVVTAADGGVGVLLATRDGGRTWVRRDPKGP